MTEGEGLSNINHAISAAVNLSAQSPAVILDTLSLVKRIRGFTGLGTCCSLKEENTSELATAQFVRANDMEGKFLPRIFIFPSNPFWLKVNIIQGLTTICLPKLWILWPLRPLSRPIRITTSIFDPKHGSINQNGSSNISVPGLPATSTTNRKPTFERTIRAVADPGTSSSSYSN